MADTGTPSFFDIGAIVDSILAGLFDAAARIAPPTLVHPVLGTVEPDLGGLWPVDADAGEPAPARLLSPPALRKFLLGSSAQSQALGKLDLFGLALDPLQAGWSAGGDAIGEISVAIVDDSSAPAEPLDSQSRTLTLSTSDVEAIWGLHPLAMGDDTGAALAMRYVDLLTAAVADLSGEPGFQAAAAGRALPDLLAEVRTFLVSRASAWLAAVLGMVRLRAAQQQGTAVSDVVAELSSLVTAYNDEVDSNPPDTPFLTWVQDDLLAGHPSLRLLPNEDASVGGRHITDLLRSAIRHEAAGRPVLEDGRTAAGGGPNVAAPDPGSAVVTAALTLAKVVKTYTQDPVHRWDNDQADCSSFVQRVLFAAGYARFNPGPDHTNVWNTHTFATADDVFTTVTPAAAQPGDLLVQGGFVTAGGTVTWRGHIGVHTRPSPTKPGLLEGISMGVHGPNLKGPWGVGGVYDFGESLLILRLRIDQPDGPGPVMPDAVPAEGGTRVRISIPGLTTVTEVTVGGVAATDVGRDTDRGYVFVTVPPAPTADPAHDVVLVDLAEQTRTLRGALHYVTDLDRVAAAVVASYRVVMTEILDMATHMISTGTFDDTSRTRLSALLRLRTDAIDEAWYTRLTAAPDGLPGPAADQLFTAARTKLATLSRQVWTMLAR